jgi:flagellar motility protein MotE (MotC chaperone)
MKLKDLLGISLVSIFLFPVILIAIMLAAGVVHLEFGSGKGKERLKPVFTGEDQARQDEAEAKQLKAFKALELKEKDLRRKEAEVNRETERVENLKLETVQAKDEIAEHRRKIEELVAKNGEIQDKQIASLAEVYGGMRPDEAAPILLSLEDPMVVRILKKIPESRSTSKLMAALGALDVKRAAHITLLLGGKGGMDKAGGAENSVSPAALHPASEKGKPAAADAKHPEAKNNKAGETKQEPAKQAEPSQANPIKPEGKSVPKQDGPGKA